MTVSQFRRLALSLPGVEERSHMEHPDFRVGGRIFAGLGYPDKHWGMVKLTPEQQRIYTQAHPAVFKPAAGSWGLKGSTLVLLKAADANADVVAEALKEAWQAKAPKSPDDRKGRS